MRQRLHVITLGVEDLGRAKRFYQALGWQPAPQSNADIAFFDLGCLVLGLFNRRDLAEDATVAAAGEGFRGMTLAHNVTSKDEVDRILREAVEEGGTLIKAAAETSWGGYSGYFADPDGHLWEVAHNPHFPIDTNGYVRLSVAPGSQAEPDQSNTTDKRRIRMQRPRSVHDKSSE